MCDLQALAPTLAKHRRAPRKVPEFRQELGMDLDGCVGLGPLSGRPHPEKRCEKKKPIQKRVPPVKVTILTLWTRSAEECVTAWVWADRQLVGIRKAYPHADYYDRVKDAPPDPEHLEVDATAQFDSPQTIIIDEKDASRAARTMRGQVLSMFGDAIGDTTHAEFGLHRIRFLLAFDTTR